MIHQFSKIGRLAMMGGNTRVNTDVPPFFMYVGFNAEPVGLNVVGLKRAGFSMADVPRAEDRRTACCTCQG